MKIVFSVFAILCIWLKANGVDTLTFEASTTPGVVYALKYGTNSGGVLSFIPLGTNQIISLTNGPWGRFFFTVTATIVTNGVESIPSNELLATNRPASPLQLRIVPMTNVFYIEGTLNGGLSFRRLAVVTNDPALLSMHRSQMIRASVVALPPLP